MARIGERDKHLENIRKIEGTLPYSYAFGAITASTKSRLDIENLKPKWKNYMPFNAIHILNLGGVNIKVYINDDTSDNWIPVGNGGAEDMILPTAIRTVIVENLDTSTESTANLIFITLYDTGRTADEKSKSRDY